MMTEEDILIETPNEPQAITPKASLITSSFDFSCKGATEQFKNLSIINILNKGKFPVFLVQSRTGRKQYAMKLFILQNKGAHTCFENEIQFKNLSHPNVIKMVYSEQDKVVKCSNQTNTASLIVFEYAPYGDFLDVYGDYSYLFNEKLVRTYFRQLIEGLEYLHSKKIAHLDIKLENLLLGEDFKLKITDFDLSSYTDDFHLIAKGTAGYRAPEVMNATCRDGEAADIYSAAIVLFGLKSGGNMPHNELSLYRGVDLYGLMHRNEPEFWRKHCEFQNKPSTHFDSEFQQLFSGMTKINPKERFTISQIKNSNWYNGPVYNTEELHRLMKPALRPRV